MVSVSLLAWPIMAFAFLGPDPASFPPKPADPARAVASAMGKGAFPWYDAPKDAVKTINLRASSASQAGGGSSSSSTPSASAGWYLGDYLVVAGFAVGLVALIAILAWFWRLYEPSALAELPPRHRLGHGQVEELPAGLRREFDSADPWGEAVRRRDQGDLAGSIVCLFAHQLLTLSRLGLVRLLPGRTGRQLVRVVSDAEVRGLVQPTLRQFEAVYYGHRTPTPDEFAAVWIGAEAFERHVAAGVTR